MTDETELEAADRVKRALHSRAERTAMSPNALDSIRGRSRRTAGRPVALAGAAAVVAVLVGIAVLTRSDDAGLIDTADSSTTTIPTTTSEAPPTTTTDPPVTTLAVDRSEPGTRVWKAQQGLVIWPLDDRSFATSLAAATSWTEEVLGLDDYPVLRLGEDPPSSNEDTYIIGRYRADNPPDITLHLASPDGGASWVLVDVDTASLTIDLVEYTSARRDSIRVTGRGSAFEGTGLLTVGAGDHVIVGLGATGTDWFSTVVPSTTDEPLVIRLQTGTAVEGDIPDIHSFVVTPEDRSTDVIVVGVANDDVLNVRRGPGVDNKIVGTLGPDLDGLVHTGASTLVDGNEWWEISEPSAGWVNSRFLSVQHVLSPAMSEHMLAEARRFLRSQIPPVPVSVTRPQPHPDGTEIGGIGVFADAPSPFMSVTDLTGDTTYDWNPFPAEDPTGCADLCLKTVADFLDVRDRDLTDAEYVVGPDPDIWTGLEAGYYDRFATAVAYVPPSDEGELDWRSFTFAFDFVDGTPTIRAVWVWGWTP